MSFFLWYYTEGLAGIVRKASNAFRYVLYRSNIRELFLTLISAWRRDVSFHTWRGFHPILALQSLANNLITRFLGMIVRSVVIVFGLISAGAIAVLAFALVLVFALAPGAMLVGLILLFSSPLWGAILFLISFGACIVGFFSWQRETSLSQGAHDFAKTPWLPRILARFGLTLADLPVETVVTRDTLITELAKRHIKATEFGIIETWERKQWSERVVKARFFDWENLKKNPPLGKYWTYGYTPHLDRYVTDLSEGDFSLYRHADLIGRKEAFEMLTLALLRPVECSALLIGEPGIGKKTLIHALARSIREGEFSEVALNKARVLLFDLGQVISDGRTQKVDPKSLVRSLMNEAVYAGNVILVIENIEQFLSPESNNSVSDVLHDYLGLPACRIIGTMTPASYHALSQRELPTLKFFERITLQEPTQEETIHILLNHYSKLEEKQVVFTLSGLTSIVESAERYNWETPFPERAIDLAEEALLFWMKNPTSPTLDEKSVQAFLSLKSGTPLGEVGAAEKEKLLNLETLLHERIVGQHEAVREMAEAFRKARAGLGNDKRPIGSFLFLGPTGVGKTETAKALAAVYFGDEEKMVRLDMSEFQTAQALPDLIGSAEGEDTEGRLTSLVKEHPFSILLLDEIEKANPKVLDLFLQILDEGFVTDGFGHRVNFRNMIIIATSNAGAEFIRTATKQGQSMKDIHKELINTIIRGRTFRPEFLNRFDGTILFNALTPEEIVTVTERKLTSFSKELKDEKQVILSFAPGVVEKIVADGYEPEFGVRSINRYIADVVEDKVVKKLLTGEMREGSTVTLTAEDLV